MKLLSHQQNRAVNVFDFHLKSGNNIAVAIDYERFRNSPEPVKHSIIQQTRERVEGSLRLDPKLVETDRFFRDIYMLRRVGIFDSEPDLMVKVQQMAADPKIRGDYVNILKNQDTARESEEVLATLQVGQAFEYNQEDPFRIVFEKLETKHQQLIVAAAEARRQEEARRRAEEAARRQEEARRRTEEREEARRQAEEARRQRQSGGGTTAAWTTESNAGKSAEWVAAQEKIAKLWEERSRTLPQGIDRETQAADIEYFAAGFNLLKDEILGAPHNSLAVRAMLEYLVPNIWRQPRMVEPFFKRMQARERGNVPTNLGSVGTLAKGFFIPLPLQNLTVPPDKEQSKKIRSLFRNFNKAMHADIANNFPDVSKTLQPHVDVIHKAINDSWNPVNKLLVK